MSIDTYFCFCCLSTNDLSCLYSNDDATTADMATINYANLLETLFNVTISQDDYEYDGYICKVCARTLMSIQKFKVQVFETLNILRSNGLIQLLNQNNHVTVEPLNCTLFADEKLETFSNTVSVKTEELIAKDKVLRDLKPIGPEEHVAIDKMNEEHQKLVTQYKVPDDFKCNICEEVMPNVYTYHTHMNQHYPNHVCDTCGKGFLTEKRLKRHKPSHETGPFRCPVCEAEFSNYNTLNSHRQRKHSTVELYKCPHCPQRFSTYNRRAVHLAVEHQTGTEKYVCKACNRSFLISGNLSSHMRRVHGLVRSHTGSNRRTMIPKEPKSHRCTVCHKKYPRKKALVVHMRTHTDDRRFACDICGKRFIQKCTLLKHTTIHNRKTQDVVIETNINAVNVEYTLVKWSDVNKK